MEIYLYNYGDKGLTSLHEKFEISKFEELEKKLGDMTICTDITFNHKTAKSSKLFRH